MELLETAYPEVVFDSPDARPLLRKVLDESLERPESLSDQQAEDRRLQDTLATAPLLSFRCPLPHKEAQLRIRLPRRYPDSPLKASAEGTPQLSLSARTAIADAASDEAARISGELRREPQCLQVLGEAMRKAADLAGHECAQQVAEKEGGLNGKLPGGRCAGDTTDSPPVWPSGGGKVGARESKISSNGGDRRSSASAELSATRESVSLGRRLIYSHHIIAAQKRTGIIKAARELRLGGFSKVRVRRQPAAVHGHLRVERSMDKEGSARWQSSRMRAVLAYEGEPQSFLTAPPGSFVSVHATSDSWPL